jgi:hypothetical protein
LFLVAIDEFCKQLARANPCALAQWLLDVSGVGELAGGEFLGVGDGFLAASEGSMAPAFYWQLIDTELAAESHRADTVILQPHQSSCCIWNSRAVLIARCRNGCWSIG